MANRTLFKKLIPLQVVILIVIILYAHRSSLIFHRNLLMKRDSQWLRGVRNFSSKWLQGAFYLEENLPLTTNKSAIQRGSECLKGIQYSSSQWFQSKYDPRIQPFWTADNIGIQQDTLKWWQSLQAWKRNIDLKEVLEKLFSLGMPSHLEKIISSGQKKCISCAVVGNSANLYNSQYGETIDGHDIVIRFNEAMTKGYEKDVGTKTTHQIAYPESVTSLISETGLTLLPVKPLDVQWLLSALTNGTTTNTYKAVKKHLSCNVSKISILHPQFFRYVHMNWLDKHGKYPSTGIVGVSMALQICDQVDIFGFGANKDGAWHHYWEKPPYKNITGFRARCPHGMDTEKAFLEKLESEGVVHLYKGI